MVIAVLTENKRLIGRHPTTGRPVAATLFKGNRHRVVQCDDHRVIIESAIDGTTFETPWRGIRILAKEE